MANEKFSISEALTYGWTTFRSQIGFFIGFILALAVVTVVPDLIVDRLFERGGALYVIFKIIIRVIGLLLGMVATRVSLDIFDTGRADLSRLKELLPLLPSYFVGKLLYGIAVLVGLILLIIPGFIFAYMFLYVGYLIVDRRLGPIEALQESRVITNGVKIDLFLFSLIVGVINILGAVCFLVGLLVTIPLTLMASAYVYRRLAPRAAATVTNPTVV
jgi:uncharacterized membrane protein